MMTLGDRLRQRKAEDRRRERAERKAKQLEARRQWRANKPRPLLDLIKSSTGLLKWLLLAGVALYLFFNGTNLFRFFGK